MELSYFRINVGKEEAIKRLSDWIEEEISERTECEYSEVEDKAVDEDGQLKGECLYCFENEGWTVFEDVTGGFSDIDADSWAQLAADNDFLFVSYDEEIPCAEMIIIEKGKIKVEYVYDADNPEYFKDVYRDNEEINRLQDWTDVVKYTDEDILSYSDTGTALILK